MSEFQLLDSEVKAVGDLWAELQHKYQNEPYSIDGFDRMVKDRFAGIGFIVDVKWYSATADGHTPLEGVYIPEIEVLNRLDPDAEFDHERMAAEVQANVLDLPGEHDLPKIKAPSKLWTPGSS